MREAREVDDVVHTAVRVWAERQDTASRDEPLSEETTAARAETPSARRPRRAYPAEALIFDTETRDEPGQRLMLGVWRFYRDDPTGPPGQMTCIEEGFFYPDDLPSEDPDGWQTLQAHVAQREADVAPGFPRRLQCVPLSWWLEHRLHNYGARHRDRCAIVGFNLPFDLGAIASYWAPARGAYRGGWSLGLWGAFDENGAWKDARYHRRILARSIDPRRTLFAWGSSADPDKPQLTGQRRFIDLRTLVFALTDRSHSLESACTAFGDPFEKADVPYGVITPQMLAYARDDVHHTATLYRNCLQELARHSDVDLTPHALYSPAGVGAAYLRAMGVTPPLEKFQLDPRVLGWSMSAFFGGRAEARIVRNPVPVVVADFTSMYPAINALLDTWPLLTAADFAVEDVTTEVHQLFDHGSLTERLYDPATWRDHVGITLVQLENPDGVILPVRANYEPGARDYGIGVNPLTFDGSLWYALPDVLAAAILGDAEVPIVRAIRLRPQGQQAGLRPIKLRGTRSVDPRQRQNPFVAMIEERHRVKRDPTIHEEERKRLDLFLKITANATAYGSLARFDRQDEDKPVPVTVYGSGDDGFTDHTQHPEKPGPYCFPPLAASITAGARLMLALIERAVRDRGGSHAFMDTDSIAIVALPDGGSVPCRTTTDDQIQALTHAAVRELLKRFESLNPYGGDVVNDDPELGRSPWKVEHDSLATELWCYAIASKRYALYHRRAAAVELLQIADDHEESHSEGNLEETNSESLTDWSEHGLGLYLDPTDEQARDSHGRRKWVADAWEWILATALGSVEPPLPPWAERFALTQFTVSTPRHANWFRTTANTGPRPFGFGLIGHVSPLATGLVHARPAAAYSSEPHAWPQLPWYDRHTGERLTVESADAIANDPQHLAAALTGGSVPVQSIADVLRTYSSRPEHKSLGPSGDAASHDTVGQLRHRPLRSATPLTALIGKEGNRLLERATGELTNPDDYRTHFGSVDDEWTTLVLPVLRQMKAAMGTRELADRAGVSDRQVRNWLSGRDKPHAGASGNRQRVTQVAASWAADQLRSRQRVVPTDPIATLYAQLSHGGGDQLT